MGEQLNFLPACLWALPFSLQKADWIYCCDVLEHIPPDRFEQTLKEMADHMLSGGFLSVCLKEDLMGESVGEPLHLTVKPGKWWLDLLSKYFEIKEQEEIAEGLYLICSVLPKN